MKDTLIVVDMQNDFIDGSLGTKEAVAIVPNVAKKIKEYREAGKQVIFTRDTHLANYLETHEGKLLPVMHCIFGGFGWQISNQLEVDEKQDIIIDKMTFGFTPWDSYLMNTKSIELCGLCSDICVISNALIMRALFPDSDITVDASCCAGVTPEKHKAALEIMKSCQIEVINE